MTWRRLKFGGADLVHSTAERSQTLAWGRRPQESGPVNVSTLEGSHSVSATHVGAGYTRLARKGQLLWALVLTLVGCQGGGGPASSDVPVKPAEIDVGTPTTQQATDIALVGEKAVVTVGMSEGDAFKAFPKTGGFEFDQNPPHFGTNYRSKFWEDAGQHGFGVVLFQNKVVGAMYQEEGGTLDRVNEFVKRHQDRIGPPTDQITGKHVTYWFWDKDGQRLMICAYANKDDGKVQLTAAMGDDVVMDGIHATIPQALESKKRTEPGLPTTIEPSVRKG